MKRRLLSARSFRPTRLFSVSVSLCLCGFFLLSAAGDSEWVDEEAVLKPVYDNMRFSYRILAPEMGSSDFWASNDTIGFRLYYVDFFCSGFDYVFEQDGADHLIVRRKSGELDKCSGDEEMIYGVEGAIAGVKPGKYLFELQTGLVGTNAEPLFREVVTVRKPAAKRK